jgi:hypothetical protein
MAGQGFERYGLFTSTIAVLPWLMPRTREETLEERRQHKAEYGQVFDAVSALFFRYDPIGIRVRQDARL